MFEKIKTTLLDYVDCDPNSITPESEFLKDLQMNSYDIITMIGQLEDEFGITIAAEDLQGISTVADLANYLSERV